MRSSSRCTHYLCRFHLFILYMDQGAVRSCQASGSGVLWMQEMRPPLLGTWSSLMVLPLKNGVGQNRAMHAPPAAGNIGSISISALIQPKNNFSLK